MKKEYSCGCLVYYQENGIKKYLVIRQKNGNHFGFPKGHVEEGETPVETALREVFEETGVKAEIRKNKGIKIYYHPCKNVKKEVTFFLAETNDKNFAIQEEEIEEIKWLTKSEVLKVLTFNNDRKVFNKLTKELEKGESDV